ncbi:DUF2986 domain-containing protein [Marinicellulosiphila megalodicopiae]|uniref:DUF2986 domain-containing protein n=1 Tax=Marinicellulosiphila megalodicopiae TaxID=2724896 RepID=UPI003BAF4CEC
MNRRKKINDILKKRKKQANEKVSTKKKNGYVSKADRAALEIAEQSQANENNDSTQIDSDNESK